MNTILGEKMALFLKTNVIAHSFAKISFIWSLKRHLFSENIL
jgi:hypothetical protein